METKIKNMKERILERIKSKDVAMRPRRYFLWRLALLIILSALILLVSVFIFNFIFFTIRISKHAHLMRSSVSGFLIFLRLFPWGLLLIDVLLLAILENLLRNFQFAYKRGVLYIFFILLSFSIAVGLFIDRAFDYNDRLLRHADEKTLPGPLNDFYRGARRLPPPEFR